MCFANICCCLICGNFPQVPLLSLAFMFLCFSPFVFLWLPSLPCWTECLYLFCFYWLPLKVLLWACFEKSCTKIIQQKDVIERQSCSLSDLFFLPIEIAVIESTHTHTQAQAHAHTHTVFGWVPEAEFCPACSVCCLHPSPLLCQIRKMTFGKVNEMGQFIREAEPEPDVKKSKGMIHSHLSLSLSLCILPVSLSVLLISESLPSLCHILSHFSLQWKTSTLCPWI